MFITFKGIKKSYASVMAVGKPYKAPVNWGSVSIPGRAGVILTEKTIEPIVLPITFMVEGSDHEEYLRNAEDFSLWLDSEREEELVLSDDPNRSYMAVTQGAFLPDEELNIYGIVTVQFLIPEPYKYAQPKTAPFVDGVARIFNHGSMKVKPLITAQVTKDLTYLDIMSDENYFRIGKPQATNTPAVPPEVVVYENFMTNLTGWTATGTQVDGTVAGAFGVENGAFKANSFGTVTAGSYAGPALKQAVPNAPLTDYQVEVEFTFPTTSVKKNGRMEVYLLDDQGQSIGKIAMKQTGQTPGNWAEIRLGGGAVFTYPINNANGTGSKGWNNFDGIMRLTKKGNKFTMYIAQVNPVTKAHTAVQAKTYIDHQNIYVGRLSQIQVHIGKPYWETAYVDTRIKHLRIWRLNDIPSTDPRIIAKAGDTIQLDFKKAAIYINGEERRELKDIPSTFFSVERGITNLGIYPFDSVTAVATIREGYL